MKFQMQAAPLRIFHALLQACHPVSRMGYAQWRHAVFGLLLPGRVFTSFVYVRLLAGGRPAATYLFCFAKKGMPKKATAKSPPLRVPACASQKMGNEANSLRLQGAYPLASGYRYAGVVHAPRNPCCTSNSFISNPFSAQHKRQRHMRKANVNTSVVQPPFHCIGNIKALRTTAICCF